MNWTAFWNGIASIFEFIFKIVKPLANTPNAIVWVIIICMLGYWTLQLRKHTREVKKNGGII